MTILVAQNDDPELLEWLANAMLNGGSFVKALATAALVADHDNYPRLRPLLLEMRAKYSKYEPSDVVKQEIRERPGAAI
jgi:hypothetical protein